MNRVQYFLSLFLIFSIANVQARLKAEGIVGGDIAEEGQYGYQVSLATNSNSFCGGGIIDDHYVVTAAHCFIDANNRWMRRPLLQVIAGTSDLRSSPSSKVIIDVQDIFVPAEYDGSGSPISRTGDIAILKLRQSLQIDDNPNLRKLELPDENQQFDWVKAVVTGFGWSEVYLKFDPKSRSHIEDGGRTDDKMRYAHAVVMDHEMCAKKMRAQAKHLCAAVIQRNQPNYEGVCSGDSGSPLAYGDAVIGVASGSPMTCDEKYLPTVYTRVSSFVNFIKRVMDGKIDEKVRHLEAGSPLMWFNPWRHAFYPPI